MATPEELEFMCCCLEGVTGEQLSALAAAMASQHGLSPRVHARILWRTLAAEATDNVTVINDEAYAALETLVDVAPAAGVPAPSGALLLQARDCTALSDVVPNRPRSRAPAPDSAPRARAAPGAHRMRAAAPAPGGVQRRDVCGDSGSTLPGGGGRRARRPRRALTVRCCAVPGCCPASHSRAPRAAAHTTFKRKAPRCLRRKRTPQAQAAAGDCGGRRGAQGRRAA